LTDLLIDTNINEKIQNVQSQGTAIPVATPVADKSDAATTITGGAPDDRSKALQDAADAIVKLCGNMSILINQIVPGNFLKYWNILTPLMKPKYENEPDLLKEKQKDSKL
jgi:hypothetical protein